MSRAVEARLSGVQNVRRGRRHRRSWWHGCGLHSLELAHRFRVAGARWLAGDCRALSERDGCQGLRTTPLTPRFHGRSRLSSRGRVVSRREACVGASGVSSTSQVMVSSRRLRSASRRLALAALMRRPGNTRCCSAADGLRFYTEPRPVAALVDPASSPDLSQSLSHACLSGSNVRGTGTLRTAQ